MYLDISKYNLKKFRQEQVNDAIFKKNINSIDEITTIPKEIREEIKKDFIFPSINTFKEIKNNEVIKKIFKTKDEKYFETVLIIHKERNTLCVSSQIGCPIGCIFCATGGSGYERNLTHIEIVDQVLQFSKNFKISNIVFMGMGEPFLNIENLEKSINILTNPKEFNMSPRKITISTIWIGEKILNFVKTNPQINIAVSLHSAIQNKREKIIPIAKEITLNEIEKNLKEYFKICNRRITLEYIVFKNFNDKEEDIKKLVEFIKKINQKLIHVNLLKYNKTNNLLEMSEQKDLLEFKKQLEKNHIKTTIRKSMGENINSACGMLKKTTSLPQ